ncbi:hypothetical protein I4U23_009349 [Adineta vaga]|nr:hypothetical protein I4U23_009349 [Adineta vaga]
MFPVHNYSTVRKTRLTRRRIKRKQQKLRHHTTINSPSIDPIYQIVNDLKRSGSRFSSYTITELEPICQQIAIQQMSVTPRISSNTEHCPLICLFCQNLIYDPITFYCGHTFCDHCIQNEEFSMTTNCPRCPDNIQEQVKSSIVYAREKSFKKNRFLQQLFDRSETFKAKYDMIRSCYKGQTEFSNDNYQKAIDIYTHIIDQCNNDHLALYHRAKAYAALKDFHQALLDANRVVSLKPQWAKGYLSQSEILFEKKYFTAALRSSMKALAIDPDDSIGKQIMARHLHAVLHADDNDNHTDIMIEQEYANITSSSNDENIEATTSATEHSTITMCKSTQLSEACFCSQFDYKNFYARDFECSICVNLLWIPITTPCGHVFCRECLIRSVDNTQSQCPICKSSLEDFFPLLIHSYVNQTETISKLIETYFPTEYNERQQIYEQENVRGAEIPRSIINQTESIITEIPIFVCVLTLPFCTCPLHVFEPRYRLMMRRTIETESRTFGMCTYDEHTSTFADYGTLLYIRGLVYTPDGRSVVDTIGQRRFRVLERGTRDGYNTAKVELIHDYPVEQHEFDDLFQLNRDTYNCVRQWFDQLDTHMKYVISQQFEEYPPCDDLEQNSVDGPKWTWIMLNLLPIESVLQYTALASRSLRIRLQMINDTINFQLNQQQTQAIVSTNQE